MDTKRVEHRHVIACVVRRRMRRRTGCPWPLRERALYLLSQARPCADWLKHCDSALVDEIIDELTSFGSKYKERVIYLGRFCLIKGVDLRVVSKCISNCREDISSSTKAH